MTTIAIVDDRKVDRKTLRRLISALSPQDINVIDTAPLQQLIDYPSWLRANSVGAVIVDERLYEQATDSDSHVSYNGHELAKFLRQRLPDFPIFVITAFVDDDALVAASGLVEAVIKRSEFEENTETYVTRITRAAVRFRTRFQADLRDLSELSKKIAAGQASQEETDRAKAIQLTIGFDIGTQQIADRTDWLQQIDAKVSELKELQKAVNAIIQRVKK